MNEKKEQKENQISTSIESIKAFSSSQNFELAQRIAKAFSESDLVPKIYQKNIPNCLIALELANRMNASPLMVAQNLDIIQGKPSFSSKFLISCVNSCGRFEPLHYKIKKIGSCKGIQYIEYIWENQQRKPVHKTFNDDIEDIECIAWSCEKGSNDILESTPVSISMAIKEGWYTKEGSKWKTMPMLMLQYRSAAFWNRVYCPELTMGMNTIEEMQDIEILESRGLSGSNKIKDKVENIYKDVPKDIASTEEKKPDSKTTLFPDDKKKQ